MSTIRPATLSRPQKELKGFTKVSLLPGRNQKPFRSKLDFRAFAFYHPAHQRWVAEDGAFDSSDWRFRKPIIRHTLTVNLQSTQALPCILNIESTLTEWLADPRGKVVFGPMYGQIEAGVRQLFGGQERYGSGTEVDNLGVGDVMDMMNDMPLLSVLMFQQRSLPMPPEEIVAGMLLQSAQHEQITFFNPGRRYLMLRPGTFRTRRSLKWSMILNFLITLGYNKSDEKKVTLAFTLA